MLELRQYKKTSSQPLLIEVNRKGHSSYIDTSYIVRKTKAKQMIV